MDNYLEVFSYLPIIIFFVFVMVIVTVRKKALDDLNKKHKKNDYTELLKTHKIEEVKTTFLYCPACNTKIDVKKARMCHVCKTDYICPTCHRCRNVDQHRGI